MGDNVSKARYLLLGVSGNLLRLIASIFLGFQLGSEYYLNNEIKNIYYNVDGKKTTNKPTKKYVYSVSYRLNNDVLVQSHFNCNSFRYNFLPHY